MESIGSGLDHINCRLCHI